MYSLSVMVMLVIFACWACRKIAMALGQPRLIGDILAGVIIGPSLLGSYLPDAFPSIDAVGFINLLRVLSEFGLVWVLVDIFWCGTHLHNGSIKHRKIIIIACFSISIPFLVGAMLGYYSSDELAPGHAVAGYIVFCGIAFSVTALPVLAHMINQFKIINQTVGGVALAVAVYTDAFAWLSLAFVVGLLSENAGGHQSTLTVFGGLLLFFVLVASVRLTVSKVGLKISESRPGEMLVLFVFVVFCACLTESIGVHYSIGAISAAYVLADVPGIENAWDKWEGNLGVVMIPMFFIGAGTLISFSGFNEVRLLFWAVFFLVAGLASKMLSSFFAGLMIGMRQRESLELGVLMATKGTAELVILSVGRSASVLSDDSYAVLLLLSVVSTLLTVPLLALLNGLFKKGCSADKIKSA